MIRHRYLSTFLILPMTAAVAAAHPMVIHCGTLRWVGRELRIELAVDDHSMQHELAVADEADTPRSIARHLVASIRVVPHNAAPLEPARIEEQPGNRVACTYEVPDNVDALALMHVPGKDVPPLARQFVFSCFLEGGAGLRWIHLTSGQNYEVLLRSKPGADATPSTAFVAPMLSVSTDEAQSNLDVQIDFPCALLPSRPGLVPLRENTVSSALLDRSKPALDSWVRQHFAATAGAGRLPRPWDVASIEMLAPSGAVVPTTDGGEYSVYTTRVRVRIQCHPSADDAWTDLRWTGFDVNVMSAPVTGRRAGADAFRSTLTPTQNTLRLSKTGSPWIDIIQSEPRLPARRRPLRPTTAPARAPTQPASADPFRAPMPAKTKRDQSGFRAPEDARCGGANRATRQIP